MTENMPTSGKVNKMMERVRGLLAKASSTDSQHEADLLLAKAEELMIKYAIDEAQLEATRPAAQRMTPELIKIVICPKRSHLEEQITNLAMTVASHFRCRIVFHSLGKEFDWMQNLEATVVGFPTDLRFFEVTFTSLYLHLTGNLEPKPRPDLSFDENIYIMHEAGVKWQRIARLMNRAWRESLGKAGAETFQGTWNKSVRPSKNQPDVLVPWPDGHRLINAYKRWCKEIGDTPRAIQSPITYQRNVAEGYVSRIGTRFYLMRRQVDTVGTALALRTEDVDAKTNEVFPEMYSYASKIRVRYDGEAQATGRRAAEQADLNPNKVRNQDRKPLD